jgi:MoxR-like ATPase
MATQAPPDAGEIASLSGKFQSWESAITDLVVERRREARGVVIATLARAHHLQLGPPGTAKSFLVSTALAMVEGAKKMEVLLHGYSVMEDLYGPLSLKGLEEGRYYRQTETYVPWAHFVFADEVYKSNPTLLNTNLWAFNERKFRNDGAIEDIPLISAFFASNEGPEDPALQAFDDRIHLRYEVGPIREASARLRMLSKRTEGRRVEVDPVISIDDITRAHQFVDQVAVPTSVLEALNGLFEELSQEKIRPTDRKMGDCIDIIKATAFYNGNLEATLADMGMLRDVLWTNSKDRPIVAEKVTGLANPIDKEALILISNLEDLAKEVEEIITIDQRAIRTRRATQVHAKLVDADDEIREMRARAEAEGGSELLDDARRHLKSMSQRLLSKGFRVPDKKKELTDGETP